MSSKKLSNNIKVTFLALLGYFTFCIMDSMAKHLVQTLEVTQVIWGRFFFHFVALAIFFLIFKPKLNLKKNFKIQIIRSLLLLIATFFMFNALKKFDFVDIYIIFFTAPLILALISAIYFKDLLSVKGWILMGLSFCAVVFAVGPSLKVFTPAIIFPIVTPICWALYQFFTKLISHNKEPFVAVFYTGLFGSIFFTIYNFFNWTPIEDNMIWFKLIALGIGGFFSHFIMIYAIQLSNLSFVANFQYSQLIWSTIINFLIFGVPIGINKFFGIFAIILLGILFVKTESQKKIN
tara:strand:- start:1291 stop:2166 length:876 start_codon:yes stop_codon:yes gene_type:complete